MASNDVITLYNVSTYVDYTSDTWYLSLQCLDEHCVMDEIGRHHPSVNVPCSCDAQNVTNELQALYCTSLGNTIM